MNRKAVWITIALLAAASAQAQTSKPGLWETTATTNVENGPQRPQIPPETLAKMKAMGVKMPGMDGNVIKSKSCITKEMIDKFGGAQPHEGCEVTNMKRTDSTMTADMTCSGQLTGTGTVQATRVDADHTKTTVHFKGTNMVGRTIEWTMDSTATYLGPSCGEVQPGHPILEQ